MSKRISRTLSVNSGFTIVELIIVIIVIAIIAAVCFVSYNIFVQNTISTSLQFDLKNASKQLLVDQIRNSTGIFPSSLPVANSGAGISFSPSMATTYNVDNTDTPKTFCLSASQGGQNYFITQEGNTMPGPCPVLYLDAGTTTSYPGTGTTWYDLSGLGNDAATTCGCSTFPTYSSANGGSLIFNGTTSNVNIADPSNNSLDFGTGSFTVEAWIMFSAYGHDYRDLIYKGASSGYSGWRFGMTTTGIPHLLIGDPSTYVDSDLGTTAVGLNAWHDLAIVYNRSSNTASGYIDGTKVGSASISSVTGAVNNSSSVMIGDGSALAWYNGQIGLVSIRNTALSDNDVNNAFQALRGRYGV
ncbi:MAG TPA: LamG domain-containing protein [Candidatus Saccharimonadales bacterium]|nr:LamG domain-containing protein [Candidatus Saccharimonadales bacterium]